MTTVMMTAAKTVAIMMMMVALTVAVAAMVKVWRQLGGLMVVLSFDKFIVENRFHWNDYIYCYDYFYIWTG